MAYDPEARETSNSALIIGIVALVLVIGGALAYYATNSSAPNVSSPTIVVTHPVTNPAPVIAVPTPVVIEKPVPGPATHTTIDRNTTTTHVVPAPGVKANSGATATPAATPGTTTTTTTTTTTDNAATDGGNSAGNTASNNANNAGY